MHAAPEEPIMPEGEKKDEIPAFKFTSKKVDDSWKEEVRREREAAAAKAAAQQKATLASLESAATGSPAQGVPPAGKVTFDAPAEKEKKAPEPAPAPEAPPLKAPPEPTPDEKAAALEQQRTRIFLNFLEGLAQQALMQLGEMENPYTGQAELDLQGARYTLELLATIQAKTKGNLNETENKALTGLLNDLRKSFAAIAQEMQRQMQAQAAQRSALKPGPGGAR